MIERKFTRTREYEFKKLFKFNPIEKLNQNFIIDPKVIEKVSALTIEGANVLEIGCGPGNLTKVIAQKARKVIGVEIYPGFTEIQNILLKNLENVTVINQDAIKFDFKKWLISEKEATYQIIGNVPFNISEPLINIIARISQRLENSILIVGDNLTKTMTVTNPYDDHYTRLSFISGVFEIEKLMHIPKTSFWPIPKTDANLISLSFREYPENGRMHALKLKRAIILSQNENLTLHKVINNFSAGTATGETLGKKLSNRHERRKVNSELKRMLLDLNSLPVGRRVLNEKSYSNSERLISMVNLPKGILSKPFGQLNNEEVRTLAISLDNY